jgi:hypothetical protein
VLDAPAISGWLEFTRQLSLQITLGVATSSPFAFGVGGMVRYNLVGGPELGLPIGGGFSLGTQAGGTLTAAQIVAGVTAGSTFFLNIAAPVIGVQFSPMSNLMIAFDGGAVFSITPSPFQFRLGPLGTLLGGSVHYFL